MSDPLPAPVAVPDRDDTEAAQALAAWLKATPEQRLRLLVEMWRFARLLTGQAKPWEMENFK